MGCGETKHFCERSEGLKFRKNSTSSAKMSSSSKRDYRKMTVERLEHYVEKGRTGAKKEMAKRLLEGKGVEKKRSKSVDTSQWMCGRRRLWCNVDPCKMLCVWSWDGTRCRPSTEAHCRGCKTNEQQSSGFSLAHQQLWTTRMHRFGWSVEVLFFWALFLLLFTVYSQKCSGAVIQKSNFHSFWASVHVQICSQEVSHFFLHCILSVNHETPLTQMIRSQDWRSWCKCSEQSITDKHISHVTLVEQWAEILFFQELCKVILMSLVENGIGDDGAKALSQALMRNTSLTQLDLQGNTGFLKIY